MKTSTRRYAKRQLTWLRKLPGAHLIDIDRPRAGGRRRRAGRHDLRPVRFEKWQALGNDYLIFEEAELTPEQVQRLCDPHFGPGADGVLVLTQPDEPGYVARLRIFNPDGSEAELSGNGAREAILYLRRQAGRTRTRSASRRWRARSGRRSPARPPAASTWAART